MCSGVVSRRGEGEYRITGVGGICSLCVVTVFSASSGITVDFVLCPHISASSFRADICSSSIFEKGVASPRFLRAWMSLFAAIVAFSADDLYGMLQLCGKNSMLSPILVCDVLLTYTS